MRTQLKTLTLAAAAAFTATAHAGDKEVLDLLVKKGVITAEDRAKAIQESKSKASASNLDEVFAKEDAVKRLTFSGRVQTQYLGAGYSVNGADKKSTSEFILRRVYLGAKADVGDGYSGELVWNFADGENGGEPDKIVVTAETEFGKFDIGYQKVQWGQEENTSSSALPTVERSAATRHWAESHKISSPAGTNNPYRLGFGARHTGIHYSNGMTLGEGGQGSLKYGVSVVGARQNHNWSSSPGTNDFGVYAFASTEWKPAGLTVGLNVAENKHSGSNGAALDVSGYNPYLKWVSGDVTLLAEYLETDVAAKTHTGYNLTALYKISEKYELVARYSALDLDGQNAITAGAGVGDMFRNVSGDGSSTTGTFSDLDSIYIGVNYYINKNNAKIQAGYEMANLENATGTTKGDVDIFRVQVQILF